MSSPDLPRIDAPIAGYYTRKLRKGAISVAVRLWHGAPADPETGELLDRSPRWQADVDGQPWRGDIQELWISCAGNKISAAEYRFMVARARHARRWDPDHPAANPREPIDMMRAVPPVPPGKD